MKCISCGKALPEGVTFCMFCGAKQVEEIPAHDPESEPQPKPAVEVAPEPDSIPVAEPAPVAEPEDGLKTDPEPELALELDTEPMTLPEPGVDPIPTPEPAPTPVPAPKKSKAPIIIAAVAALAILGGGGVWFFQQRARAQAYEQAQMLYAEGSYEEAAEAFETLGSYGDASEMQQKAILWTEAQANAAGAGEDPAKWEEAAASFEVIEDPEAQVQAETCRNKATYYTAQGLMDNKDWEGAQKLFEGLAADGFMDAASRAEECGNWISYKEAGKLFEAKDYEGALKIFSILKESSFSDAADRAAECQAWIDLQAAEKLLADGKYYDAYVAFNAIYPYAGMPDLDERAKTCVQNLPATGAVYKNDNYSFSAVELTIDNSNYSNAYYKLYIGDDLVMAVFIPGGSSATVGLPTGVYTMNKAYGDLWFGKDDLFGDDGSYYHCSFGGSDSFELESGWAYTISSDGEGTGIGTSSTDRGDF